MQQTDITNSFNTGELSPKLFGRTDLLKWRNSATTLRNFFVDYRGGAASRAGTAYVGMCKQGAPNAGGTATNYPPRDIAFQFNIYQGYELEFGDQYMRIKSQGAYVTQTDKVITNITQASPGVITSASHGYSNGDWVYISDVAGMTNFNGLTWIVQNAATNTFTVTDLFGTVMSTLTFSAYVSGGTVARIYTVVSPYAAIDLPYLKFTQSSDVMSLTCVNGITNTEYPTYDLQRAGNTSWSFNLVNFTSNISPPTTVTATAQNSTTKTTYYSYEVTAIDASTGQESIASTVATVQNNDISVNAGSNTLNWSPVGSASSYNIYAATPAYTATGTIVPSIGAPFGYAGSALGITFTDTNIVPDFTKTPPLHNDPFARGSITGVTITAAGSGYAQSSVGYTVVTVAGTGFVGTPIVIGGTIAAFLVINGGKGYAPGDTIAFTNGSSATGTFVFGAASGTYPSVVAYYQQRRVYANTLNAPDTYFMSQIGAYLNMDSSVPTISSDAIIGTPWAQQINGIQFMVPVQTGLIIFTGNSAWLLNGGNNSSITPADQTATAQIYNGCSPTVPPIVADNDILYVQSKNSIVYDAAYNFITNVFTGIDRTVYSGHLFENRSIVQWTWAREPNKVVWAVRNDGIMLSLTYFKELNNAAGDIYGWARHDTNGLFVGTSSITERHMTDINSPEGVGPLSDAVYFITKRYVRGSWVYYSERMDDRAWTDSEECWCVDAGLSYPQTFPQTTMQASAASGEDVTFTAGSSVFAPDNVGDVIRVGGGVATITTYVSGTQLKGDITQTIARVVPDDTGDMPLLQEQGSWTITTPTTTVSGLNHLEGMSVTGVADGNVIPLTTVTNGSITLQQAASAIIVGLPFLPQLQTIYINPQDKGGTVQTKRKTINSVGVRMVATRGISVGTNQVDASTQQNQQTVPWTNLIEMKQNISSSNPTNSIPLFTGDYFVNVQSGWDIPGQVAIQQNYPLPANISSVVSYYNVGDT